MKHTRTTTEFIETEIASGITITSEIKNGNVRNTRLRGVSIEMEHLEMLPKAIREHLKELGNT